MILVLRTDGPTAELYLTTPEGSVVNGELWESGRDLAEGLLDHIQALLDDQKIDRGELTGIIVFSGPGSFTSLRIGHTVANALADSLGIPVVGAMDDGWITHGVTLLRDAKHGVPALPVYGAEANITRPKG